jgi:glycosyltransferase involved in cell wall biosynthesis
MKILIPTQFFLDGSGSGIYVQNIAREFEALGHQVKILSADNKPVEGKPFPVRTIVFDPEGKSGDLPYNVPYFTTHPSSNQTFYDLDDKQFGEYIDVLGRVLQEEIESFKPDVVHCQHINIFAYHLSRMGVPYCVTLHGTDLMGFKKELRFKDYVLQGVEGCYRLISISKQVTEETKELFDVGDDKIALIHNGYDDRLFYPRKVTRSDVLKRYGIGEAPHLVSFVGKLAQFKGIDVLIRAASIYEKELPGVKTLIVGQGQLRDELETQAKGLGLSGVRFLGHKTQDEVAEIYSVADVSTVPSRVEPFGLVAIEALACGTPVVASNGGGLPDFIDDQVGRLVEMENHEELAKAIVEEIKSQSKNTKGKFAASYAKDGFAWRIPVKKMADLLEEAVKAGG